MASKSAPSSAGPQAAEQAGQQAERQAGDAQLSRRIRGALMHMMADDRMVLSLRHFSECSYQQIGQILQLDEKTVKSRLFEARQRLRGMLGELRGEWK